MSLSNRIAGLLMDMLESSGTTEIQRNELAQTLGCVPSQINYVITSRFGSSRGYMVESRRGGGGYVKITKVNFDSADAFLMHTFAAIGSDIDAGSAKAILLSLLHEGLITEREAHIVYAAVTDRTLEKAAPDKRDALRADILRTFLLTLRTLRRTN